MAGLGVHIITWVLVPQCIVHIEPSTFLHMLAGFWSGVLILAMILPLPGQSPLCNLPA